jgi:serine/threonine-protein kinase
MGASRWELLRESFEDALPLPDEASRRERLRMRHPDDPGLVEEVIGMLRADDADDGLLDGGVARVADDLLAPAIPPGTNFGPYTMLRLVGEGGMGTVYLAERHDLGSVAAVKVLRDAWLSPARRARFAAEQRLLAQMNHPGIARLFDADTLADGTPWFAMEYVEGVPLTEYCRMHRCSIERRLKLFRQACEAVRFAHAHGVMHRDIKPTNMLVDAEGRVRLLDFGIAKQLDGLDPSGETRTVYRPMTPAYAAPEQLLGEKLGVHTDVYSLGVVLHELLTDQLPFDLRNLSLSETAMLLQQGTPARPSAIHAGSSPAMRAPGKASWPDLDVLCLKAMHADPERRYSSVEALIRDVDHYLASEPLEARPEGWAYRAGKLLRRNWQVAALAAAFGLLIIGLSVVFWWRLASARDDARAEAARTARVQQLMVNLFEGGDSLAGPATNLRVVDLLDRGAREAQAMSADPGIQADLLYNLGRIQQQLGRFDRADALLATALQRRQEVYGKTSPAVAESLVALALLRIDQARPAEGEQLAREALQTVRTTLPANHSQAIAASLALGRALRERGAYKEAIALLQQVATADPTGSNIAPADRTAALAELADAQYASGNYAASGALLRRVLQLHRSQLGADHPLVAADLGRLAAIQQDLGYYVEAERLEREALAITERHYGSQSPRTADQLTSLGRALAYQRKFDEATTVLQRALGIQEQAYGEAHPVVAEAVNEIGNVLAVQNHQAEAASQFMRAARIYQQVYGERHYLVAIALSNVAYAEMQQANYAEAEPLFRKVVDMFSTTLSPDNVNTGIARIKLGRTLLRAGRPAEAAPETLAGYRILTLQTSPSISFLQAARSDLADAYDAIGQPEEATRFRAERAAIEQANAAPAHQ